MIRSYDQRPMFEPPSAWVPPVGPLPRPRHTTVAIDTETRDDGLAQEIGPGWVYHMGYIAGVSMAWRQDGETRSIYVPVRHPDTECRPLGEVIEWVDWVVRHSRVVFHRADYDMPWLIESGLQVWPEHIDDTYMISVLEDENWPDYSLDSCCERAGVAGKDMAQLYNACAAYGIQKKEARANLWRLPARHVGPYAEQDAIATLDLLDAKQHIIDRDSLRDAYNTELALLPVIRDMRHTGIPINEESAERAQTAVRADLRTLLGEIGSLVGRRIAMTDLRSPDALEQIFLSQGVTVPRTAKGAPSVTKDWLEHLDAPIGGLVRRARAHDELAEKFIGTYILSHAHNGRIHAEIHQLKDQDGGTRTFRLAYSNPPLQQMPSRDDKLAPLVRRIFVPERGCWWAAPDFGQQEFRIAVDRAVRCRLAGAMEAARYYCDDPKADFHNFVVSITHIARKHAKIINFGMMFGMGREKLARSLGLTLEQSDEILEMYHQKLPWIKGLSGFCEQRAQSRGFVRLIDGARCHFDHWEPAFRGRGGAGDMMLRQPAAREMWPDRRLRRAKTRNAMNRVVSGSAARQTKLAMVQCHREGLTPMLQMHDELCFSVDRREQGERAAEIMRTVVRLVVPVAVDLEYGRSWGDAKHTWEDRDAA